MARQLIQHRLKTNILGQTGSYQKRGSFVKKPLLTPPDVPLAALTTIAGDPITTIGGDYITVI